MAYWLLKTEPGEFSAHDIAKGGKHVWDGVANATALIHLRNFAVGDQAFIYHTGSEKQIVSIVEITKAAYPDPKRKGPERESGKFVVVGLCHLEMLEAPVPLALIKSHKEFAEWDLVRIGRLSVVPTSEAQWNKVFELSVELSKQK